MKLQMFLFFFFCFKETNQVRFLVNYVKNVGKWNKEKKKSITVFTYFYNYVIFTIRRRKIEKKKKYIFSACSGNKLNEFLPSVEVTTRRK